MIEVSTQRSFSVAEISILIKKAPPTLKKLIYRIAPFDRRYGQTFVNTLEFLNNSSKWSKEELKNYQFEQFKLLIEHCYENVPYYNEIFKATGIKPIDFKNLEDMAKIPTLSKQQISRNFEKLHARNFDRFKQYEVKTSGSTGEKLRFHITDDVYKKEAAFVLQAFHAHGATMYDKPSVWLRRFVPIDRNSKLQYYDHELRRLYMSAYHLNDVTISSYLAEIEKRRYHTLVAYPSSAYILALLCERNSLELPNIRKIHVSSEMLLPEWRKKIIDVFKIVPVAHYGAIEKVSFMYQTETSANYFPRLEYGVNEFFKNDLGHYNIIATGFLNWNMPFIRYLTEDSVSKPLMINGQEVISEILGRTSDVLVAKDGSLLPGVNFYSWIDKKIEGVAMFRITQKSRSHVVFEFVRNTFYSTQTYEDIKKGLNSRLGDLNFQIEEVSEISRHPNSGKIRCIINEIPA